MDNHIFFLIGLTFLIVHEMDAVRCKEWTIFPLLSRLKEETGYIAFTTAHIPLVLLLFLGFDNGGIFNAGVRAALDGFFLFHILLHAVFHRHPQNRFASRFSWLIILGAGASGLLDFVTIFLQK